MGTTTRATSEGERWSKPRCASIIPPDAYAIAFPRPNWDAIRGTLTVDAFRGIKRGYHCIQDVTKAVQDCKRHKVRLSSRISCHIAYIS
jgi:hypothetical protein